jgi:hypothetical protein
MSLIEGSIKKQKKTAVISDYMKEYRAKNLENMKAYERNKYYKNKFNLEDKFIEKFGIYSGDVYKIQKDLGKIKEKHPELITHILELLRNV